MKSIQSPSVVRLSAAPKRVVHQVVLAKRVAHVERKVDTTRVPMKQIAEPRQVISGKGSWTTPSLAKRSHRAHQAINASLGMTLATGMLGKLATVLLVPMLFFQPLMPLFAADESVAPAEPAPVSAPESVPTPVDTPPPTSEPQAEVAPTEPAPEAVSEEQNSGETATEELPQEDAASSSSETPEAAAPVDETEAAADGTAGGDAETIIPDETVEEQAATDELVQEGEVAGESTTTPEVVTPEPPIGGSGGGAPVSETEAGAETEPSGIADGDATTTDETVSSAEVVEKEEAEIAAEEEVTPTTEEDVAQAAREAEALQQAEVARQEAARLAMRKEIEAEITKGCLTIDNVGYYCLKNFEGMAATLATSTKITSIQSLPDTAGDDKEIFITRNGESIQLTHNTWDDTFPAMDVTGTSLVWQGMSDGRWQIFFADLSAQAGVSGTISPTVTQLTHSTESNFNPRVDGNTVVWQGWVGGNWEIFLADHLSPSSYYPDGEEDILPSENRRLGINGEWHVSRLSENETHDMFPAISGGLVTWQSFQEGSWNVYAYNMKTGESTQLSQGGVKSENPRFAVTWDERDAAGNIRMVGYDIASGMTIDLTSEARHASDRPNPYQPELPLSQSNQAALPPTTGSGTTTPARADGDDEGGLANGMDV